MDSNWLMPTGNARIEGDNEGDRPSGSALLALVDQNDPAFTGIVGVLHEMRSAGVELDESAVRTAVAMGRGRCKAMRSPKAAKPGPEDGESIVYYVRRANLMKIGTTRCPNERFATLLPDEILAWEPGSQATESARHREFAAWRLGGSEFFEISDALTRHTTNLRERHGEPDPSWPTLASVSSIGAWRSTPLSAPDSFTLVTLAEGVDVLGIKRNTADGWVHRKCLLPTGKNEFGYRTFLLAHMRELAERSGLIPHDRAA